MSQSEMTADRPAVPPVLYIPVADADIEDVTIEFRHLDDGRVALLAYTALDRLVQGCGRYQPWVVMPTAKLDDIEEYQHYDVILLDVQVAEEQRRKAGEGS